MRRYRNCRPFSLHTLTWSIESLSLCNVVHTAINRDQNSAVCTGAVVGSQLLEREISSQSWQFWFRHKCGHLLGAKVRLQDLVDEKCNYADQSEIYGALDNFVENLRQHGRLCRTALLVGHRGHGTL